MIELVCRKEFTASVLAAVCITGGVNPWSLLINSTVLCCVLSVYNVSIHLHDFLNKNINIIQHMSEIFTTDWLEF